MHQDELPVEAIGEDEIQRPQPADEPISVVDSQDLYRVMRHTIERLEKDQTARGDLKILSRTLRELRYAFTVFRPYRRRRKVTIFGSARTQPNHPEYQSAVQLGEQMAEHGWMVITGAGGGIMEAGHRGAGREASMGLNIMLPFEQSANDYIVGDPKLVTMKYFFTRKLMFVKECSAVVCLPGGFGTLDEALETLTLMQTGKQTMIPLVLLDHPGGSYWSDLGKFIDKQLLGGGMISPEDVESLQNYQLSRRSDRRDARLLQRLSQHALCERSPRVSSKKETDRSTVGRDSRRLRRHPGRWKVSTTRCDVRRSRRVGSGRDAAFGLPFQPPSAGTFADVDQLHQRALERKPLRFCHGMTDPAVERIPATACRVAVETAYKKSRVVE